MAKHKKGGFPFGKSSGKNSKKNPFGKNAQGGDPFGNSKGDPCMPQKGARRSKRGGGRR